MPLPGRLLLALIVVALLAASRPALDSFGQVTLPLRNEPEPVNPELPVIAHGVASISADEIGWSTVVRRAPVPSRASAAARPGAFVLAQEGAIAVADAGGAVLARLAPGEAVWIGTEEYAVVSLESRAVAYVEIALRPAANLGDGGQRLAIGLPFAAPPGEVFDLDLIRGVLERDAESAIAAAATPSVLLVTRGAVWVTPVAGATVQLTTGGVLQVEGDVVLTGASRTPATFVIARVGPPVPGRLALKGVTPESPPTPHAIPARAAVATAPAAIAADIDADGDGPADERETIVGTDPAIVDSDGDGLSDRDETEFYGTEALAPDTDGDGLADAEELLTLGANPLLADTDGDGAADGDEIAAGTDPLDAASAFETPPPVPEAGPLPNLAPESKASPAAGTAATPEADLDGDGLSTSDEVNLYGTNPAVVDSDGDGFSDGGEVVGGTDPLAPSDGG